MVSLSPKHGRSLRRMLLTGMAAVVVAWLGLAALVVLSILWLTNPVPQVLLGLWLYAIVALLVWPTRFGQSPERSPWLVVMAPAMVLSSMVRGVHRVWRNVS